MILPHARERRFSKQSGGFLEPLSREVHALEKYLAVQERRFSNNLVKPVNPERFAATLRRLEGMKSLRRLQAADAEKDEGVAVPEAAVDRAGGAGVGVGDTVHVPLPGKGRTVAVRIGGIFWIESLRNHTRVCLEAPGRILLFPRRLCERDAALPAGLFARLRENLFAEGDGR